MKWSIWSGCLFSKWGPEPQPQLLGIWEKSRASGFAPGLLRAVWVGGGVSPAICVFQALQVILRPIQVEEPGSQKLPITFFKYAKLFNTALLIIPEVLPPNSKHGYRCAWAFRSHLRNTVSAWATYTYIRTLICIHVTISPVCAYILSYVSVSLSL